MVNFFLSWEWARYPMKYMAQILPGATTDVVGRKKETEDTQK